MSIELKYYKMVNIVDHVGDVSEGEGHMRHFSHAVNTGTQPRLETMRFVADAFSNILRGVDQREAFKLAKGSGSRDRPDVRAKDLTMRMRHVVMVEEYIMQGYSQTKARQAVSNHTGSDLRTIGRHHEELKIKAQALIICFKIADEKRKAKE